VNTASEEIRVEARALAKDSDRLMGLLFDDDFLEACM
jgi:hypothetical protein